MKKINYKLYLILYFLLLSFEVIFLLLTYKHISLMTFLAPLFNASIMYLIFQLIKNKYLKIGTIILIGIIYIANYIYFNLYDSFITLDVFVNSTSVVSFGNVIFETIKANLIGLILFILLLIMSIVLVLKHKVIESDKKYDIGLVLVTYIIFLTPILISSNDIYSYKSLYFKINFSSKNLYDFGLLTSIRLDLEKLIFSSDKRSYKNENIEIDDVTLYNMIDVDFVDSKVNEINEINEYLSNRMPSSKNMFTGLLKDKNLIFILAESFNTIAIDKELTPNLYRLFNDGYTFTNYYNPLFPVSTADAQYMIDTGLYPADSTHSLISTNKNYHPFSLANSFKGLDYKTYSYHNYDYDYYERDKYYTAIGFDKYIASKNGLDENAYKEDSVMMSTTIKDVLKEDKFFAYYLTMSGHAPYIKTNEMCLKHLDKLDGYNLSLNAKYFMSTQIELDKMVGILFDELEASNKLDDTVIVLTGDHVPYGLNIDEINELSTFKRDNEFEKYRSSLVIYNKDINKYDDNTNYASNIDILPTLLNLFGIEYDSRLLIGTDILSNQDGLVVFGNRNLVTKDFKYSNMSDTINGNITKEEINDLKEEIYMKFKISRLILKNNYYQHLFR